MNVKRILFFIMTILSVFLIVGCSGGINQVSGKEDIDFPPSMTGLIQVNEAEYEMKAGGYRWERKTASGMEVVRTDAATPNQIGEEIEAIRIEPNSTITIEIDENPEIDVYLWNANGKEKAVPVHNKEISAPNHVGTYIYEVVATWSTGEVSYTFVVDVN